MRSRVACFLLLLAVSALGRAQDAALLGKLVDPSVLPEGLQRAIQDEVTADRAIYGVDAKMCLIDESSMFGANAITVSPDATILVHKNYVIVFRDTDKENELPEDLRGADGSVFFGMKYLNLLYGQGTSYGVPYAIAHEFAHVLQFKKGMRIRGQLARIELHADFMAGYVMAKREQTHEQDDENMIRAVFLAGDSLIDDPEHHGTSEQRLASFLEGAKHVNDTVDDAFVAGMKFVGLASLSD